MIRQLIGQRGILLLLPSFWWERRVGNNRKWGEGCHWCTSKTTCSPPGEKDLRCHESSQSKCMRNRSRTQKRHNPTLASPYTLAHCVWLSKHLARPREKKKGLETSKTKNCAAGTMLPWFSGTHSLKVKSIGFGKQMALLERLSKAGELFFFFLA